MRVITGTARGRKLQEPSGMDIRPTADVVKEAVFNIIQFDIEGRRVLDLFAGTGQLGIEALSRGAAECVFVDESRDALKIVSENLSRCKLEGRVMQSDGPGYLERGGKFDIIFLDPPYDTTLLDKCLEIVQNVDILTDGGIIVCESRREKVLPELKAPFARIIDRNYDKIKITVYKKES